MKIRLLKFLACPICRNEVKILSFEKEEKEIKSGVLICANCETIFPVYDYVPRLFIFSLPQYSNFKRRWKNELKKIGYDFPKGKPEKGEMSIQKSFSAEWSDYEYTDTFWIYDKPGLKKMILKHLGYKNEKEFKNKTMVDIGCGNGTVANFISGFGAEVIGIDLSYSTIKAAQHFKKNSKLHFVQGSLFHPPFKKEVFDIVYSMGVLHHTFDTKKAFFSIVDLCKNKGRVYISLYGDVKGFTKMFTLTTNFIRYFVSRLPSRTQNVAVETIAIFYGFAHTNLRKYFLKTPTIKYNKNQLIHTVRDRFTPVYAHTHKSSQVMKWFDDAGLQNITLIEAPYGISIRGDRI